MSAAAPQAYDPTSAQPYTPVAAPPTPEPRESPFQGQPGINMTNMGAATGAGQIAGLFDNVLHGFVNGMAQGQQHKALTLKKKSDDLTASYNADAQRAYQYAQQKVAQDGKLDPDDPEYQKLKSAVDGSWGALQDFRGTLLEQGGGKKKGKKQDQQLPPVAVLTNPKSTPQEKAQAYYDLSQKAGSPLFGQIQSLVAWANSDQYKQQRQTQTDTGAAQGSQAATNKRLFDSVNEYTTLIAKSNPTPEDQQRIEALKTLIPQIRESLNPSKIPASGGPWYSIQGEDKKWYEFKKDAEGNEVPDTRRPISVTSTRNKPIRAWDMGANGKPEGIMLDPSTNQKVPGSENPNLIPPSSMLQHISNGFYIYTDPETQEIHKVPIQRSSGPVLPSARSGGSTAPANTPGLPLEHANNTDHPNHPQHTGVATPRVDTHAATRDGTVIGHKGVPKKQVDDLDRETNAEYQKAVTNFNASVNALSDPNLHLTPEQITAAKKKFYDQLQEENNNIGKSHSQRMRDLGLIPAEDSAKQAAAPAAQAPAPKASGGGMKKRTIYENGDAIATTNMTDEEVKAMNDDPDFKKQGGTVK